MVRTSPFTLLEEIFSYTSKEIVGKHIKSKLIPLGTGYPLKEIKRYLKTKMINRYTHAQEDHKKL